MPSLPRPPLAGWILIALTGASCARPDPAPPAATPPAAATIAQAGAAHGCLASHDGYLRARLRGAVDLDINWPDADLQCEGGVRPDGHSERLTFAGRVPGTQRRLRFVFGIAAEPTATQGRGVPTNVTIIFEGEQKLYSTRGEDKCTIDALTQQPARTGQSEPRHASARGFCVAPATSLSGDATVLLSRFDFSGPIFDEESSDAPQSAHSP